MSHMLCTGYFYKEGGGGFAPPPLNYPTIRAYLRGAIRGFKPPPPPPKKKNSDFFEK